MEKQKMIDMGLSMLIQEEEETPPPTKKPFKKKKSKKKKKKKDGAPKFSSRTQALLQRYQQFEQPSYKNGDNKKYNERCNFDDAEELLEISGPIPEVCYSIMNEYTDEWLQKLDATYSDHIYNLQNPEECDEATYIFIDLRDSKCGFGCQLHRVTWALLHAMMENRTLVLYPQKLFRYGEDLCKNKWDCFLQSISNCTTWVNTHHYSADHAGKRFDFTEDPYTHSAWLPPMLENQLKYLEKIGIVLDPSAWHYGQLMKYIFKLSDRVQKYIGKKKEEMEIYEPFDAVFHVRRGDKIKWAEAKRHDLSEYISKLKDADPEGDVKTIYIATDDADIEKEIKYPEYTFTYSLDAAKDADSYDTRFLQKSLDVLLFELLLMAEAKYFIGTFSSQVGRVIYELYFGLGGDPSTVDVYRQTLDDKWYAPG